MLIPCLSIPDFVDRLNACASALSTRLVSDGYLNTRILADTTIQPGRLIIRKGQLAEIRVYGPDKLLNTKILEKLNELKSGFLNLNALNEAINKLEGYDDIETIKAQLLRLGSQVTQASLKVQVFPKRVKWESSVSLSNDGNSSNGELSLKAGTSKQNLLKYGDNFVVYLQTNQSTKFDFGSFDQSISYLLPITRHISFTSALGFGINNLIGDDWDSLKIKTNQFQSINQLNWKFHKSRTSLSEVFISLSTTRSNLYINGKAPPLNIIDSLSRKPSSSYLKSGLQTFGSAKDLTWQAQVYGLQGIPLTTSQDQLKTQTNVGIDINKSRAVGMQARANYRFSPTVELKLSGSGQLALAPLVNTMNFVIGSDQGLIGFPSQFASGNHGFLGTIELPWTIHSHANRRLLLIPFAGIGYVESKYNDEVINNKAGSYGAIIRYIFSNPLISVDIGWVDHLSKTTNLNSRFYDSYLGKGVYTKVVYSF